ncbi:hypothetical protein VTL71DRAFT_4300 [Oculimacula yallundae]|uniref:ABM domain-containing protein n=1 Tax=Oculimacula yallundae TaxID=86028 RepID=A0ABR4C5G8_9HELO
MATPVTEIAYITLKPGIDISGSSDAAKAWKESLAIISKQEGYQRSSYGLTLESPDLLLWFIDWDSRTSHINFTTSPAYTPFTAHLSTLLTSAHFHHILFPSPPSILISAPIIEFATFLNTTPSFPSQVEKFIAAVGTPKECYGGAFGESVEMDVKRHEGDGEKGRVTVLVIGWESREAHFRFRETEVFKESIELLGEGNDGVEMVSWFALFFYYSFLVRSLRLGWVQKRAGGEFGRSFGFG